MNQDRIKALFDQQAEGYDAQWSKTAPIRDCLHFLLSGLFADAVLPGRFDSRLVFPARD